MSIREYTEHFNLEIPNFSFPQWHQHIDRDLRTIDGLFYLLTGVTNIKGIWRNSTSYLVDDRVIDAETGTAYVCLVNNTSPATGTFEDYRTANPSHWTTASIFPPTVTGQVEFTDTTEATSLVSASVEFRGGVSIDKDLRLGDDLFFDGTETRIYGDFSAATVTNRTIFQTTVTNGSSVVYIIPNGTSATSGFGALNNSIPTNSAGIQIIAAATAVSLRSIVLGSGTALPLELWTNGVSRVSINATTGDVTFAEDILLSSGAVISFNSGDVTITHAANSLAFTGGTYSMDGILTLSGAAFANGFQLGDGTVSFFGTSGGGFAIIGTSSNHPITVRTNGTDRLIITADGAAFYPFTNDAMALGLATNGWANFYLGSGAVINWNNGDVTLTHSANFLDFAGASSGIRTDSFFITGQGLFITTNDGGPIGTTTESFSDLFLAAAGVINWSNGTVTLTQGTRVLTLAFGGAGASPAGLTIDSASNTGGAQLLFNVGGSNQALIRGISAELRYFAASGHVYSQGGLVIGAPTGGHKGDGTANVQNDIYKNNTAYTNPDYVFEKEFTGKIKKFKNNPGAKEYKGKLPLTKLRSYVKRYHHLPGRVNKALGMFARADWLLEKIEELTLYILELEERLKEVENGNS